jgi:hypothetical protein
MWEKLSEKVEKENNNYLGKYFPPYLQFLTFQPESNEYEPSLNMATQERRIFWLVNNVTNILKEAHITPLINRYSILISVTK